jgi:hypothetical protein
MAATQWLRAVAIGAAVVAAGAAQAQTAAVDPTCPRTRAEVRAECIAFMKTHQWSEEAGDWVLKAGGKAAAKLPEGVTPREKIRAERDAFLRTNKWNEATATWDPLGAKPREVSKLSRAEVQKETAAFMRTHQWDETAGSYVLKAKK